MRIVKTPYLAKKLFTSICWSIPTKENTVYLTFDDGPTPIVTPWVLDLLNEFDAKATFFCLGKNVKNEPALYTRILDEGHAVGNHSQNHVNAWKTNAADYLKDVNECSQYIASPLFRPPYGKLTPRLVKELKKEFTIVLWDVLSYDFDNNITVEHCLNNVIKHTQNGSIVVFHDSNKAFKQLKAVLPPFLAYLKERKIKLKSVF